MIGGADGALARGRALRLGGRRGKRKGGGLGAALRDRAPRYWVDGKQPSLTPTSSLCGRNSQPSPFRPRKTTN